MNARRSNEDHYRALREPRQWWRKMGEKCRTILRHAVCNSGAKASRHDGSGSVRIIGASSRSPTLLRHTKLIRVTSWSRSKVSFEQSRHPRKVFVRADRGLIPPGNLQPLPAHSSISRVNANPRGHTEVPPHPRSRIARCASIYRAASPTRAMTYCARAVQA